MFNKITNRILLGYAVPLLILILLAVFARRNGLKAIALKEQTILIEHEMEEVDEVAYELSEMVSNTRGHALFPGSERYRTAYNTAYAAFSKNGTDLINNLTIESQSALARELMQEGERLHLLSKEVFQLIDANSPESARRKLQLLSVETANTKRRELLVQLEATLAKTLDDFEAAERFLLQLTAIGILIVSLAIIAAGLTIIRPLRQQLPAVVSAAEQIAAGDLSQTIQVTADKSELGVLLAAFRRMNQNLNALIAQAQKSGIQISTSTTQIAAAGRQLEATVTEQVASINEVQATSQEIATTAGDLAQTIDEVTEHSQNTAAAASRSQVSLGQIQGAMQQLVQATETISAKLGVMDEKASNINNVVTTITKVADQTNLLSLNAAIEAEKAGEYGAGFAVVAREIRRLADQTAVATLEIEQMVKEMQSSVSGGVMEMDKFNKEVSQYVEEVGQISGQISQVIEDVQGLTPRFEAVSQRMDQQYQGAEQISVAIAQLSEASHQTVESLQETNGALTQLDDAAQGLQKEISTFKCKVADHPRT